MNVCKIVAVVCLVICGCSKKSGPPTVQALPVTGKVTLDGKPLPGADVVFLIPDPPMAFAGTTKDDGSYQLQGVAGKQPPKGHCKVMISRMLKPDGTLVPPGTPPAMAFATESLPPKYSMANSTELSADVLEGGGEFNFAMTSK